MNLEEAIETVLKADKSTVQKIQNPIIKQEVQRIRQDRE